MNKSAQAAVNRPGWVLPVIIVSQFAGTSLWFAGNAVLADLQQAWQLASDTLGPITSAVQFGFILGTLVFAILAIPDRFSPRKVFLVCALSGALSNLAITLIPPSYVGLLCCRFATGFFLAGLYPVGMKIAAGWYQSGLGRAIGYLVAALVLGTAFPHLLKSFGANWPWQQVIQTVSVLAAAGGVLLFLLVVDGPYTGKAAPFNPRALLTVFQRPAFRASAFGYFGHMWELYAFWAFLPVFLLAHLQQAGEVGLNISLWTFLVIAMGAVGCAGGGWLSVRLGSAGVAMTQLTLSGLCCLLSPLLFFAPTPVVLAFLLMWGVAVAGDSPQFSALNATNAPAGQVGSALTIANSMGFAISIVSIELLAALVTELPMQYLYLWLLPGPVFGVWAMQTQYRLPRHPVVR